MFRSKCQSDKHAYRQAARTVSLKNARHKHYSDLVDQCLGDSRKLFKIEPMRDDIEKLIRDDIENIVVDTPIVGYPLPDVKLDTFRLLSQVYSIIMKSSNATRNLDPIPTTLLKLCARKLTPVIMKMISLSLNEGHIQKTWKVAILMPILKRPVSILLFVSKAAEKTVISQLFEYWLIMLLLLTTNRHIDKLLC